MYDVQSIESMRDVIATLVDLSSDKFAEITKDKNTSMIVLGTYDKDLVVEVTYFDPKLKKYIINHVVLKIIRKHKLIPEEKIEIFEPFALE